MIRPKLIGCCSACDLEVFEILQRDPDTRAPKKVSGPTDDAVRATFLLADGSRMDLTFCRECASTLEPATFPALWSRCMASWIAQSGSTHPWVAEQTHNGIMGLLHAVPWKDIK